MANDKNRKLIGFTLLEILETEKNFNLAAGISEVEDRLPEFMLKESLPPTNSSFTVSAEEIEKAFSSIKGFNKL